MTTTTDLPGGGGRSGGSTSHGAGPARPGGASAPATAAGWAGPGATAGGEHPRAAAGDSVGSAAALVDARGIVDRAWWVVAGVVLVLWALDLSGTAAGTPATTVVELAVGLWGMATVAVGSLAHPPLRGRATAGRLAAAGTLLMTLLALATWSEAQVRAAPSYGTDEIAYDQYAATLAAHGIDPYTRSMGPAFDTYQVSPNNYTFELDGRPVTALSYPALSFEVYLPFLAVGWATQMAVAVNVAAWALGIVLLFLLLPRRLKPMAVVVGSLSIYVSYAVGGVTDAVYVPFLVGAAYAWNRYGEPGRRNWVGPVLLGLAMAVKQTPWLVLPFVVAGITLERRAVDGPRAGWVACRRYLGTALAAFLVPNLPYLVTAPRQWLGGVLTPVLGHAVPAGQGAVGLSLFLGLGGGSLTAYTVTAGLVMVALWFVYVASYPVLRPLAFFAPSLALFFSSRSFGSYLVSLIPAAVLAVATMDHERDGRLRHLVAHRAWRRLAAGGAVAAAVAFAVAVVAPAPLALAVTSVQTTGQLATVSEVAVRVTNRTDRPVTPAFTVDVGGSVTAFWPVATGPRRLAAHQRAMFVLRAPNFTAMPAISAGFTVDAFTDRPATASASGAWTPEPWHVSLQPDALGATVAVGHPVTVRVQLRDALDRPVHQAGIPVSFGQVIYGQHGLEYSTVIVNRQAPGTTPVVADTDSAGVATFVLVATQAAADPVSFEANLVSGHGQGYPYGYSTILPIQFTVAP